ncbi:dTDP-6-deoxy-L-hexose 3-O-methyltransferase [Microvirga tunisiensis]|uniref:dTDP-6-deoxy-L-hexose 3-O-methyltransferase n=1 Tax=Pannonibacter tanglangensis TaxID=2750084 RepID=A0A7X5J8A2_9HYPH|nr:TylF/MycF/NovP-related O-methyltransferase [Pannonibacter sp. XCT-53]NBN78332.1 dTDP-6-deoxy-L-hexose 3-O-methyltransferase [Pannonibacter sp. XCT-53]
MTTPINSLRGLSRDSVWDYENGFYWFSDQSRINKLLAHYELYRRIVDLPGDVVEFGVFKGLSLIRFAQFRALMETDQSRRIVGFDAFGKFPSEGLARAADRDFIARFEAAAGHGLARDELGAVLREKGFGNIDLVAGDVFETLPRYLASRPELRLSLLHLDMDVAEPTRFVLETLYDRVVPGGLVVIDDYATVAGATDVVDDFLRDRGLQLRKLPNYRTPAFIVRP